MIEKIKNVFNVKIIFNRLMKDIVVNKIKFLPLMNVMINFIFLLNVKFGIIKIYNV
jgi:hypothetical protein